MNPTLLLQLEIMALAAFLVVNRRGSGERASKHTRDADDSDDSNDSRVIERLRHFGRSKPLTFVRAYATDSGAASLTAVLQSLGRSTTTLEQVKDRCTQNGNGEVITLVEAARSFGLQVVPLETDIGQLSDVPRPAVVGWDDNFVILEARRRGRWTVLDPTDGRRRVTDAELSDHFTGTALSMTAGPQFWAVSEEGEVPGGWRTLARVMRSTPGLGRLLTGVMALSMFLVAMGLVSPLLTKLLIDQVLPQRVQGVVPLVGVGLLLLAVTRFLTDYLRGRLLVLVEGHLDNRLMSSFFAHMLSLPYRFFQERSTGDLVQRLSSNSVIRNALSQQTVSGVLDGVLVVVYAGALFWISPPFALVAIAVGLTQVVILAVPARRNARLTQLELERTADSQSFVVEVVTGAAYTKASGVEGGVLSTWARLLADQLDASMRRRRFAALLASLSSTVSSCANWLLLLFGVSRVLSGDMSLGSALALISLSSSFIAPLTALVTALQQLQNVQGHVERISEVLVLPAEQANKALPPMASLQGHIELRDVSFRYGPDLPWAVRHISLTLEPGQRVAVVGGSGSGKSTVARILLGLHVPDEGTVLVDGVDLHSRDLGSFRRQCGVVMQDPVVFDGTISDNVAFHDPQLANEDIEWAIRMACLHDDVAHMPEGLDTLIDERGTALSGGQRQRLALARALAHRPALLVLDEATSALDQATEAAVNRSLHEDRRTTLVIAHRLSTIREADCIVVLEQGEIAEVGTHDTLSRRGGAYTELVSGGEASLQPKESLLA